MILSHQGVSGPWTYEGIEGAGHWVPLDHPKLVSELILRFVVAQARVCRTRDLR